MRAIEIENNLHALVSKFKQESFIFNFLLAYGTPKSTIKRLQGSDHDKLTCKGELILRKKLFFKTTNDALHVKIDELKSSKDVLKHSPRFIIVTDYETLLAYGTKTDDRLDIKILNITNHYDFFLPLAGMEKATFADENPADVKASLKMAKLYDELQKNNEFKTKEDIHALNVFLTRLLFCYFAEDTNIFADNSFTNSIASHTHLNGSDVQSYLHRLFRVFNIPKNKRDANTPAFLDAFPYVNGGLFQNEFKVPIFSTRSRQLLLEIKPIFKLLHQDEVTSKPTENKKSNIQSQKMKHEKNKVFIVHGHDNETKQEVARFIESIGLKAIILHEQASRSMTIIEKIEYYSNEANFAIVLYTPCDKGRGAKETKVHPRDRARQNVVFEHGYLMAKIGRGNVCALVKGEIETPSDISGVVYTPLDTNGGWKIELIKELKACGYSLANI